MFRSSLTMSRICSWLKAPQSVRRTRRTSSTSEYTDTLESRTVLTAAFGFNFQTIASDLSPTLRFFGSPFERDAPFTVLRYGQGQVTSLTELGVGYVVPADLSFKFGSDNPSAPVEVVTLSSFDNGLSDGIANQVYTPDSNDHAQVKIFQKGVAVAEGLVQSIALETTPANVVTSARSTFLLQRALGSDTRIFNELMSASQGTGVIPFSLSAFNLQGPWIGVGDAEAFVSTGQSHFPPSSAAPEVDVKFGNTAIPDGGSSAYGSVLKGAAALTRTFTVKNLGSASLTMTPATLTGAGFTIVTNVPATLAPGATANLIVRLDTAVAGIKSAVLSFNNNDSNENPYNFTISGTVTVAPEVDVTFGATGIPDGGTSAFGSVLKGAAALTRTFTVKNLGSATLTMTPATLTGAGFTIVTNVPATLAPGATANLIVRLDTAVAGIKSAVLSFNNNDSNENPYNFTVSGTVTVAPEVDVTFGATGIPDGGASAFGSVLKGAAALTRTFTVKNLGSATLTMTPATLTGAGFTIVTNVPATLAPGATANLIVRLDTAVAGIKSAVLSFNNNDSNENPYNFTVSGTVTVAPEVDVTFGATGIPDGGTSAFGSVLKGAAALTRTFTVKNLGSATLTMTPATLTGAGFTIVTNVPATLAPGATANLIVRLDTAVAGIKSAVLSFNNNDSNENPYNFTISGTVTVAPEVDVTFGATGIPDGGTSAFGSVLKGAAALTRTFTVKNLGSATLTMTPATLTGAGFTIVTNVPATLAPGATANLIVRLDTAVAGIKSAVLSFNNNDSNENPYNFTITGTVTLAPPTPAPVSGRLASSGAIQHDEIDLLFLDWYGELI